MVTSGFEMVETVLKVEWKSVTTTSGALCVMMPGGLLMLMWPADSLDLHQQVHVYTYETTCASLIPRLLYTQEPGNEAIHVHANWSVQSKKLAKCQWCCNMQCKI